jgi:hypothetical protein
MLAGIREYIKEERITWKFLLIFSFTATMKTFAIFVFLPLVFLKEKRILSVVWDLFVGFWGILLCVIPYAWREDYKQSTAILNDVMKERLFSTVFPAGNVDIPIFFALLVALCIWCYMQKVSTKESLAAYAVWISLAVFAAFFIFVFAHPYWIVLIAPFVTLIIAIHGKQRKINMILEPIISASCMFVYFGKFGVFMTETNWDLMIMPKLGLASNGTGYAQSSEWIVAHGLDAYFGAAFAVFAVCLIAFLIINHPKALAAACGTDKKNALHFDHGMVYVRTAMLVCYILVYLYISYVA